MIRLPAEVKGISLFRSFQTGHGGTEDFLHGGTAGGAWHCQLSAEINSGSKPHHIRLRGMHRDRFTARLHTQSPPHIIRQPSARVSLNLTSLLPQSRDCSSYVRRPMTGIPTAPTAGTHWSTRTLPTFDVRLGSLTLPAPKAGQFVELLLLYIYLLLLTKLFSISYIAIHKSFSGILQGESLAWGPKLLSIKNYDLKIYIHIPWTMQNRTCS